MKLSRFELYERQAVRIAQEQQQPQ